MRLIASGRLRANVHDVACVAQELEAGERSAFVALVASDHVAARLLREEEEARAFCYTLVPIRPR